MIKKKKLGDAIIENAMFLINGIVLMCNQMIKHGNSIPLIPVLSVITSSGNAIITYSFHIF